MAKDKRTQEILDKMAKQAQHAAAQAAAAKTQAELIKAAQA